MKDRNWSCWALAVAIAAGACGGTEEQTPDEEVVLEPPAAGEGVQYRMTAHIDGFDENEKCKFVRAPAEGMYINRTHTLYTEGSHHLLLYVTGYDEFPTENAFGEPIEFETPDGVFDCTDGLFGYFDVRTVAGGAQNAEDTLIDFPPGVALEVPPNAVLVLNTHYLNPNPGALDADVFINLYTIPPEQVTDRGGVLLLYNPNIVARPGETSSARFVCPIYEDITLVSAQSHMHARGVGFEAFVTDESWNRIGDAIYTETSWDAPINRVFPDGGLKLEAGQFFDYRCDYANTGLSPVYQGPSANDEMCAFVGAYYPYNGPLEFCAPEGGDHVAQIAQAGTSIGTGNMACMDVLAVINEHGVSHEMQDAITRSCPSHARALKAAYTCTGLAAATSCSDACAQDGSECSGCIEASCAPELDACAQLTACE